MELQTLDSPGESAEMDSTANPGLENKQRFGKKCHKLTETLVTASRTVDTKRVQLMEKTKIWLACDIVSPLKDEKRSCICRPSFDKHARNTYLFFHSEKFYFNPKVESAPI